MEAHITSVCKAADFHISNIRSIHQYLSEETAAQVIDAFVTSRPAKSLQRSFERNKWEITVKS